MNDYKLGRLDYNFERYMSTARPLQVQDSDGPVLRCIEVEGCTPMHLEGATPFGHPGQARLFLKFCDSS